MRFKPTFWFPIAVVAGGVNLVWAAVAAGPGAWAHAGLHAMAAVGFGLWAFALRNQLRFEARSPERAELPAHLEELEAEMSSLQQQLIETQERLDFTERLLAQRLEADRVKEDR